MLRLGGLPYTVVVAIMFRIDVYTMVRERKADNCNRKSKAEEAVDKLPDPAPVGYIPSCPRPQVSEFQARRKCDLLHRDPL